VRIAIAITLSAVTSAVYAQPAPTAPADPEPAPGVEPTPAASTPTEPPPASPAVGRSIAIDGAIVVPMSDYADDAKIGFGVFGRVEFPRSEQFALTVRVGGLGHVPADNRDTLVLVPAFGGIQFMFAKPWFVAIDAGLVFSYADKFDAALGLAFGGGYRSGRFSARAEFLVPDVDTADSTAGVLATVGYSL
jgi:hypothetical protein